MKQKQKKTNKTKKKNDEKKLPKQNLQCKKEWPILNMYNVHIKWKSAYNNKITKWGSLTNDFSLEKTRPFEDNFDDDGELFWQCK